MININSSFKDFWIFTRFNIKHRVVKSNIIRICANQDNFVLIVKSGKACIFFFALKLKINKKFSGVQIYVEKEMLGYKNWSFLWQSIENQSCVLYHKFSLPSQLRGAILGLSPFLNLKKECSIYIFPPNWIRGVISCMVGDLNVFSNGFIFY